MPFAWLTWMTWGVENIKLLTNLRFIVELFQMAYPYFKYWNPGLKTSCFAQDHCHIPPRENLGRLPGMSRSKPTHLRRWHRLMWLEKNDISTLFPPISGEFHGDEFTMVKSMVYHPYKKSSTEETTCSRYTSDTTGFFHGFVTFLREVGVFFSRRRPF